MSQELKGLYVEVNNGNLDKALRIFKQIVKDSNLMIDLYEKSYYIKPSAKRKDKKNKAIARQRWKMLKNND